jgi:hypothetical protein
MGDQMGLFIYLDEKGVMAIGGIEFTVNGIYPCLLAGPGNLL